MQVFVIMITVCVWLASSVHAESLRLVQTIAWPLVAASGQYGYGGQANRVVRANLTTATSTLEVMGRVPSGYNLSHIWTTPVSCELFLLVRDSTQRFSVARSTDCGKTSHIVVKLGQSSAGHASRVWVLGRGFAPATLRGEAGYLMAEYENNATVNGVRFDDVRLLWSPDGERWSALTTWNIGNHPIRHIHMVKQDPRSGWVYVGTGDGTNQGGVIAWDGLRSWPARGLPIDQYDSITGFYSVNRHWSAVVTDILFPASQPRSVYLACEAWIAVGKSESQKGIWEYAADLSSRHRVYPAGSALHPYSGLRLGVTLQNTQGQEVMVWADMGTMRSPNFMTFYVSEPGFQVWNRSQNLALSKLGKSIPSGLFVVGNRVYVSTAYGGGKTYGYTVQN